MTLLDLVIRFNDGRRLKAQKKLAEALGILPSMVSHWCSGRYKPDEEVRTRLANVLGVSVEELQKSIEETKKEWNAGSPPAANVQDAHPAEVEVNFVPVVGTVSAEMFACVFEDNTYPLEVLPVPHIKGTKVKALKVSGDCMEPEVHDGEYVVISIGAAPEEGSLVVARVSGECTLKRIYMRGEQVTLKPDNKKYRERVVAKKDLEVLGVVLYTFKKQVPKKR